jgi:Zn-dependent protease
MHPDQEIAGPTSAMVCPSCGGEVALNLLSCPTCQRLIHSDRLKELAESAESAEHAGDLSTALATWREAITLLPPSSRQHAIIAGKVGALSRQVETGPNPGSVAPAGPQHSANDSRWRGGAITGTAGTLALLVWKFKFVAVLLLTKAKFLLLGLTKASTFLSMLASFGLYWSLFGGWFALGFVLSIYIHEMGHVAALMRYGVPATAPLFVPGLGAMIRLRQSFVDPREDARVGLAGPIWGCGAALFCAAVYAVTGHPYWGAMTHVGAFINLFNLTPVWQLDGSRAFHSLTRPQRWLAVTAIATAWALTENSLLILLMAAGAFRAALDQPAREPDRGALVQYIALVAVLSALIVLPVDIPGH